MRTGAVVETPPASGEFTTGTGSLGLRLPDLPVPERFYTFGFAWRERFVRCFLLEEGVERELSKLEGNGLIPRNEAPILLNLWHPAEHWMKAGAAEHPRLDVEHRIDGVRAFR